MVGRTPTETAPRAAIGDIDWTVADLGRGDHVTAVRRRAVPVAVGPFDLRAVPLAQVRRMPARERPALPG